MHNSLEVVVNVLDNVLNEECIEGSVKSTNEYTGNTSIRLYMLTTVKHPEYHICTISTDFSKS